MDCASTPPFPVFFLVCRFPYDRLFVCVCASLPVYSFALLHDVPPFSVLAPWCFFGRFCASRALVAAVFLHPMIRDAKGAKMSKSVGNVVDPIHLIEGRSLQELQDEALSSASLPELVPQVPEETSVQVGSLWLL